MRTSDSARQDARRGGETGRRMQILLWLHRYLGVAVGLVMTLWCLSGFVMLYRGYPEVTPAQRLAGLETLALTPGSSPDLGGGAIEGFRIEMLAGQPVLRVRREGEEHVSDLKTGAPLGPVTPSMAL